jgi:hypothetical protein
MLAAITFGIATAGGDLAWTLWVTKVAPPARVADYMSVHTFFTGLRGLAAPLVGFALVTHWSMTTLGMDFGGVDRRWCGPDFQPAHRRRRSQRADRAMRATVATAGSQNTSRDGAGGVTSDLNDWSSQAIGW